MARFRIAIANRAGASFAQDARELRATKPRSHSISSNRWEPTHLCVGDALASPCTDKTFAALAAGFGSVQRDSKDRRRTRG